MVLPSWLLAVGLAPTALAFIPPPDANTAALPVIDFCPKQCADAGPNTTNWPVYPNLKTIRFCRQTMFLDFSLEDTVDDPDATHHIQACSSFGSDFYNMAPTSQKTVALATSRSVDVQFELGWWEEAFGLAKPAIRSLVGQIREYIDGGHGPADRPFIFYGRSAQASVGVYIGQGLLNQALSASALRIFQDNFDAVNATTPSLAMQLCDPSYDSTHIFGIAVSSNGTFSSIQNAIQSWANATCLSFAESRNFTGTATFLTPLFNGTDSTTNSTLPSNSTTPTNSTLISARRTKILQARAECSVVQVVSGDSCASLTEKCRIHNGNINGDKFMKYNPGICDKLVPKQRVCCTEGNLPDFRPKPKADGSCFSYTIQQDDNCHSLAAEYSLTVKDIEDFNKKTWGWGGCEMLFKDTIMCLSSGRPPFPAVIPNAVCGPQAPNTTVPTDPNFDISKLNPCPLNACCNIWGQCGITPDFCIDTNTGPPGTAKKGTYGCISNCGLDPIKGTGNGAIRLGYFQGYGLGRACLYQDALQIDTSKFTHLHFGFGTLTPDTYEVGVGDTLATYQFEQFKRVSNAKRILSFGGWAFSTEPSTYFILREGVKKENRMKMATSIANFIKKHELDGVDIDWEYPGAPDLPDFDPGKKEDGQNYLEFLVVLKNLLSGKSVAIAAPASYYYLKQFPIKDISRVVDYIVYMTYDLHGQWDAGSKYTQEGCELGNCLRSQVNLTETRQALAMITKAGVPGNKIVVGVTSYGRSFNMAQSGCWGPGCTFTGDRLTSHATPGRCTGTGGYLADAEILEIINGRTNVARSVGENVTDIEEFGVAKRQSGRVVTRFLDPGSHSDVLVYDNNQWVAYMSESTKRVRTQLYAALGMAGTTDWATDLQQFNPVPKPQKNWGAFIALAATGANPKEDTITNIGKWKEYTCTHDAVSNWGRVEPKMTPAMRWKAVDADSAWREIVAKWFNTDKENKLTFIESVQLTTKMGTAKKCHTLDKEIDNCDTVLECDKGADGTDSGPAAYLIWHSLVQIHKMHHVYWDRLLGAWGSMGTAIDDMQNTFAPIPEPKTNQWLNVLIDLLTVGTLTAGGPFFNRMLKNLPAGADPTNLNNAKDIALNLVGQSTTLAKDLLDAPPQDKWTPQEQAKFSNYVGQVILGWMNVTERAVKKLFDGSQESVKILGNTMTGGTLIEGYRASGSTPSDDGSSGTQLLADVRKSLFGFSIPALWRVSKTYAFILDSGASCGGNPASKYVDDKTAEATGVCYEGRQYYLVHTDGEARPCKCERVTDLGPCQTICRDNKFSAPVGIGELSRFGVSKEELVIGSIRTFRHAGRKNGVNIDPVTVSPSDLADVKITTPGFVRLPVCSPDRAWQSWHTTDKGSSPNFPCDIPPGKDHCGNSDFENRTSGASPIVSDCEQIIRNIEGDGSTDFTHRITGHREILKHDSCRFGIERTGGTGGTVEFRVGGQDVIDIINESIKRFGGGGRVGARGVMPCSGVTAGTKVNVEWGIY